MELRRRLLVNPETEEERDIYERFTFMPIDESKLHGIFLRFFDWFIDNKGNPRNPKHPACRKISAKAKNQLTFGRSIDIPTKSEKLQKDILMKEKIADGK